MQRGSIRQAAWRSADATPEPVHASSIDRITLIASRMRRTPWRTQGSPDIQTSRTGLPQLLTHLSIVIGIPQHKIGGGARHKSSERRSSDRLRRIHGDGKPSLCA